jgi:HK97 gp10 family phage protein
MSDVISVEITGLERLDYDLANFPAIVTKRIYRKALKAGADIILAAIRSNAPVGEHEITFKSSGLTPGELRAGIIEQIKVDIAKGTGSATIKPSKKVAHVARWIEYGWMLTGHKPKKVGIKHIPAHPFIRPAYEAHREEAFAAIQATFDVEIMAAWLSSNTD